MFKISIDFSSGHPVSPRRKQNNEEIVNGLYGIFHARPAEMPEYALAARKLL
jgi:hypothetical protein